MALNNMAGVRADNLSSVKQTGSLLEDMADGLLRDNANISNAMPFNICWQVAP